MTKANSAGRGTAPRPAKIARMTRDGYATVQALAERYEVSVGLMHKITRAWRPGKGTKGGMFLDGKLAAFKEGANVWILVAAIEKAMRLRSERT
jgi:hypothetical protein